MSIKSQQSNSAFYWRLNETPWVVIGLFLIPILRQTVFYRTYREDISNYTAIDALAIFDVTIFILCSFTVCFYWTKTNHKAIQNYSLLSWIVYYVFCLFSFLWRVPGSSALYVWYRAGGMLIMTFYVYMMFARIPTIETAFQWLVNIISINMLSAFLKSLSIQVLHTNGYSVNAAVLVILVLLAVKMEIVSWKTYKWYFLISIICLVCGTSAGSNVAFLAGMIFYYSVTKSGLRIRKFLIALLLLLIAYHFFYDLVFQLLFPNKSMTAVQTATGRIVVWETYLNAWTKSPWLGWGFAVGERSAAYFGFRYVLSAHNGLVTVLINTGLVGMAIWGSSILSFLRQLFHLVTKGNGYASVILGCLIVLLVNNLTVPTMGGNFGQSSCTTLIFLVFFVIFVQPSSTT